MCPSPFAHWALCPFALVVREEKHAEFNAAVKELAIQHDITSGKWLFYGGSDAIDGM